MLKRATIPGRTLYQRLQKLDVKRLHLARAQRASFLAKVRTTLPTEASLAEAKLLVARTRAARTADFLDLYRKTP